MFFFYSLRLDSLFQRPGATNLRSEMSRVMEFLTQTTLPRYRLGKTDFPKHVSLPLHCLL